MTKINPNYIFQITETVQQMQIGNLNFFGIMICLGWTKTYQSLTRDDFALNLQHLILVNISDEPGLSILLIMYGNEQNLLLDYLLYYLFTLQTRTNRP